jgi:hypothetical protein
MFTVELGDNTKARFADLLGRDANRAVVSLLLLDRRATSWQLGAAL